MVIHAVMKYDIGESYNWSTAKNILRKTRMNRAWTCFKMSERLFVKKTTMLLTLRF